MHRNKYETNYAPRVTQRAIHKNTTRKHNTEYCGEKPAQRSNLFL